MKHKIEHRSAAHIRTFVLTLGINGTSYEMLVWAWNKHQARKHARVIAAVDRVDIINIEAVKG